MFIKASALAVGTSLVLAVVSLQPALADSYRSEIRQDIREIRQDRAAIRADEARLAREQNEAAAARARVSRDLQHGNIGAAIRDQRIAQHEARDVAAARAKLAADKAELNRDVRELRHDLHKRY